MTEPLDHLPGGTMLDSVLEELEHEPGGFLHTTELMARLRRRFQLSGPAAALLQEGAEGAFDKHVMEEVAEAWRQRGMTAGGLARFVPDRHGWQITREGHEFVEGVTNA